KKKNKKGKTISLTDCLAEDGGTDGGSTYGDVSTTWHSNDDDVYRAPPIDRSILPTAPRAALEPSIDWSRLRKSPPYTAFLGNLGLNISAVHLPCEPSNPERLKGFGYAEFEDLDSLLMDVADQAQAKYWDDHSSGRDRHQDSDKTDINWRARPAADSFDDYLPRSGDDSFGDKNRDRYDSDRCCDGYRDNYCDGPYYDRGYDFRVGSGRRAFGSDDPSWSSRDDYSQDYYRRDDRGPPQRPKLNLKPRSIPNEDDSSCSTSQSTAREREIEERLQKEQQKLQRQLDETGKKSLENETPNKEEDYQSPTSKPPKPEQSLKVMPGPPPKENAWVKQIPTSGGRKAVPAQPSEKGSARKDENKVDGVSALKGQSGNSSRGPEHGGNKDHWKESDRKDGKRDHDSRSAPEPKKHAALATDGENENEGDYTE
ncbi:hypothetical protein FD755_015793, partial [Muntiacus reevesi]